MKLRRSLLWITAMGLLCLAAAALLTACGGASESVATATPLPTGTPAPEPEPPPIPQPEPTVTPTPTLAPQRPPTRTPVPEHTPTPTLAPPPTAEPTTQPTTTPTPTTAPTPTAEFSSPEDGTFDGEMFRSLSGLSGAPALLHFWFPGCPPCEADMLLIDKLYESRKWPEVEFRGIQTLAGSAAEGLAFAERLEISYPLVHDKEGDISSEFSITGVPTTFVLDRAHRIIHSWVGAMNEETLKDFLDEISRPAPVSVPIAQVGEALTVSWTAQGGVSTSNSYSGYVSLTISGTATAAGNNLNDAFYLVDQLHEGCETVFVMQVWLSSVPSHRPLASLIPDGCPEFNPDHTYQVTIHLRDYEGPLVFGTGDVIVGDNSGELTVILTPGKSFPEPTPTPTPEPTPTTTPTVEPTPEPAPPAPVEPFLFDEVTVTPGRSPDMTAQLSYDMPACARDVPPLRLREDSGIDEAVDLDVLYVARNPVYGYRQAKTFPDVGELVTYTAYVANKGGVSTGTVSSQINAYWEMVSPSGEVLFEFTRSYQMSLPPNAVAEFKLGWNWQDGPNRLSFRVDPADEIEEWTEVNNSVELYTNALLVGLVFEESYYDWMNSVMNGELDVGRFYWFTRDESSPPHRPEVFGAEAWAQRHVEQMNEYFRKAEDDYFEGVRHSLPRVALQSVPVVPEEETTHDNSGISTAGAWGDLDLVWGFQATFPQEHFPGECRSSDPQGAWTWVGHYNPEFRTVEDPLIHELGHHVALRHEGEIYGAYEFVTGSSAIRLNDGSLAVETPLDFIGDMEEVFSVMQNGDYFLGLSRYAAHTMAYRFQAMPGRDVPSRVGAINAGGGNGIPRGFGNYWDIYGTENVWDWVEYEQPDRALLAVVDGRGDPVTDAEVVVYSPTPLPEEAMFPRGLPVPFSARWEGWFEPPATGSYRFLTYSLGNVRVAVDGQELVNSDGEKPVFREGNSRPRVAGREFRHGQFYTNPIALTAGQRYTMLVEVDSFDAYGGQRFALAYECTECSPNPIGLREFQTEELWTVDGSSSGLDATFWNVPGFGADGSGPFIQRNVPGPKALPRGQMGLSATPTISGTTSEEGTLVIDPTVLFPPGQGHNRTAVAVVRFGEQEFVRILSLADMNLAFWTESTERTPAMKLDGTRGGFPTLLLTGLSEEDR